MVHILLKHQTEWRDVPLAPSIAGNNLMTARVSMFLNGTRRFKCFFQPLKPKESSNSAHEQTSLSNDILDFVLRKREVGQAKELSEQSRITNVHAGRRIKMICANCHCENNKTLLLINTTFPPSTTSVEKIFCT